MGTKFHFLPKLSLEEILDFLEKFGLLTNIFIFYQICDF